MPDENSESAGADGGHAPNATRTPITEGGAAIGKAPAKTPDPDDVEPVQDLGQAVGGLIEMLDPKMLEGMKWQDAQMRVFHVRIKPRWDWMLQVLVAHARAQSAAAGIEVREPPMPKVMRMGGGEP